jgi:hypothetical protein
MGFIGRLQKVTTNNYDSLTELHTPKITVTTAHIKFLQPSLAVARYRFPTADVPLPLGSRTVPDLSYSNSWLTQSHSQSYVTSDGQSAGLSWNKAPIWGPRPDFCYCQTIADLLMRSALSDKRTGLSFYDCCWPSPAQSYLPSLNPSVSFASWVLIQFLSWPLFWFLLTRPQCHDMLKYHCHFCVHVVQRRTVCITAWTDWLGTKWLCLNGEGHSFLPLWRGRPVQLRASEAAAVAA